MSEEKPEHPLQELELHENWPIVKANKLIEASYRLSMQEQRIVLALASRIRKEDKDFHWYKVSISKLARFLGIEKNKNIYTDVRSTIRGLMKKLLTIREDTDDIDLHWIDAAAYGQKGYIRITIHPELKPYLLELKSHFTRYCLKYVINFKSIYSVRIYELLKRYEPYKLMNSELTSLKRSLGIKEDEYTLYANFKEKVLLVAQREILEKTDIYFEFIEVKDWKKVVAIKFTIKPNSNNKILAKAIDMKAEVEESLKEDESVYQKDFFEALPDDTPLNIKYMLNKIPEEYRNSKSILAAFQKYLKENGLDYVERNIAYANNRSKAVNSNSTAGKSGNYISFLNKALENDWAFVPLEKQQVKADVEEKIEQTCKELRKNTDLESRPASEEIKKEKDESEENVLRLIAMLPPKFQKLQSIQKVIQHYYHREYDFDFVARSIKYSNVKSNAVKPGANPDQPANYCAYLSQTLAGDFGLSFQENEEMNAAAKNRKMQIRRDAEEAKRKENERQARDIENRTKAEAILQTLSEYELETLRKQAIERLPAELKTNPYSSMSIKMEMQKLVLERAAQPQQTTLSESPQE